MPADISLPDAFDSVETRATNSFSPTPDSVASSASWAECAPAPSVLKCTYLSAPRDSTMSTVTSKVSGSAASVRVTPSTWSIRSPTS